VQLGHVMTIAEPVSSTETALRSVRCSAATTPRSPRIIFRVAIGVSYSATVLHVLHVAVDRPAGVTSMSRGAWHSEHTGCPGLAEISRPLAPSVTRLAEVRDVPTVRKGFRAMEIGAQSSSQRSPTPCAWFSASRHRATSKACSTPQRRQSTAPSMSRWLSGTLKPHERH
jgi:hypothetical protein